jgi:hypothetical protein
VPSRVQESHCPQGTRLRSRPPHSVQFPGSPSVPRVLRFRKQSQKSVPTPPALLKRFHTKKRASRLCCHSQGLFATSPRLWGKRTESRCPRSGTVGLGLDEDIWLDDVPSKRKLQSPLNSSPATMLLTKPAFYRLMASSLSSDTHSSLLICRLTAWIPQSMILIWDLK